MYYYRRRQYCSREGGSGARRVKDLLPTLRLTRRGARASGRERRRRAQRALRDDVRLLRQARLVDRLGRLDGLVQRRSLPR